VYRRCGGDAYAPAAKIIEPVEGADDVDGEAAVVERAAQFRNGRDVGESGEFFVRGGGEGLLVDLLDLVLGALERHDQAGDGGVAVFGVVVDPHRQVGRRGEDLHVHADIIVHGRKLGFGIHPDQDGQHDREGE
jgi:hypothetical protein